MSVKLILASGSSIRTKMLSDAGVSHTTERPRVDEEALKSSLLVEGASPRDIADALAEYKCLKLSARNPEALVIGSDQVLSLAGQLYSKPATPSEAASQLRELRGQTHQLLSAAVIAEAGRPIWRHVGQARMTMHALSDSFVDDYVDRTWNSIQHSVGGYKIEEEGVRLFSKIEGSHFVIQGMPLIELLSYLATRGTLAL